MSIILVAAIIAGLIQIAGHFLRWETWTGQQLGRLASYAWGVGGMLCGLLAWAALDQTAWVTTWQAMLAFTAVTGASGLATLGAYGLDHVGNRLHYARTREAMDAAVAPPPRPAPSAPAKAGEGVGNGEV